MKTKRIHVLTSLTLATALALTACGQTTSTDETVSSTEVMSEATVEETTETIIEEAELIEETTEAETETEAEATEETTEINISEADSANTINAETVSAKTADSYTYTDMSATMYATTALNVRDLPSTDGNVLGALTYAQAVTVTGQCNETSWYRIEYNSTTGYVSNKYLSDTQPTTTTSAASSSSSGSSSRQLEIIYTEDSTVNGLGYEVGTITGESKTGISGTVDIETPYGTLYGIETSTTIENIYDKEAAQYFAQSVNELRVQNGLNALTWNDSLYSYAIERCNTNDEHTAFGAGQYSGIYNNENVCYSVNTDPVTYWQSKMESLITWLEGSSEHYATAMNPNWTETAVGVRYYKSTSSDTWSVVVYQLFK